MSVRTRNHNVDTLKVNDKRGNPVEIAAVVVWRVEDTAQALFDVEDFENFVRVQSESALRHVATRYNYDEGEEHVFRSPRLPAPQSHGAGCAFSAALAAHLARGRMLSDAVGRAKHFVQSALERHVTTGRHHPLNFFWNVETHD